MLMIGRKKFFLCKNLVPKIYSLVPFPRGFRGISFRGKREVFMSNYRVNFDF